MSRRPLRCPLACPLACPAVLLLLLAASAAAVEPTSLSGIVVDDADAQLVGDWSMSSVIKPFVGAGYLHDGAEGKGEKSAKFTFRVKRAGEYHVLIAYTSGGNRASQVPVTVTTADGSQTVTIDQRKPPALSATGFEPLGAFPLAPGRDHTVLIETTGTPQHVIVDAVRVLTADEYAAALNSERKPSPKTAKKPPTKQQAQSKQPDPPAPPFVRQTPATPVKRITPVQFDRLLGTDEQRELVGDIPFLRRLSLDLAGRQPTLSEYRDFVADTSPRRRERAVDRYLASPDWGRNWANYWSDLIGARQPEPQLTFLNYDPFRQWLAAELNAGTGWDQLAFRMVTAVGLLGDDPAGMFVGFHQGERNKLAGETARVFLGVRIACAQCHDHPFIDMPQETFHGMAAFYARVKVELPWNDSNKIKISSTGKGEHKMPGGKEMMKPVVYRGEPLELGLPDLARRRQLAQWLVAPENPWFARSFVNHLQARMLGRGFYDPIDDLGEDAEPARAAAHEALAEHLTASAYDVRSVFRVIALSRSYQSAARHEGPFSGAAPKKLRADEVFNSLVAAIELPDVKGQQEKASAAVRFPPPPKSTRDLVREAFGFDPATRDELLTRTMQQAMFLMNNAQIQRRLEAAPGSSSVLARLLEDEPNDEVVIDVLYARVLARRASDAERKILTEHLAKADSRQQGFEDVLWSLLNSAEFTTRH